ncbi:hypothetical protein DOTSEDRAFT_27375 [Dothistroma septosporum NZE10]|uniref:Uncharacterized protein n=1 Tax=Dothistroma septosporum (strain NZE10 / CBS 128990) TaxID=675120 RepID=N1PF93_DOTSN|nr:hypothetical protein DOTSEDRAFT_27375 [Dothistroma septosporum NZE10]
MTIPSNYIATQSDAQRADLRKMFADRGRGYEQQLYLRDRHSYHIFRAMYWQLQIYDDKYGFPGKYDTPAKACPPPPTSSLKPYPGFGRPLSAISEATVETEGWSDRCTDDTTLVDQPIMSEIVLRFADVPESGLAA